jgi:hypothetical protein
VEPTQAEWVHGFSRPALPRVLIANRNFARCPHALYLETCLVWCLDARYTSRRSLLFLLFPAALYALTPRGRSLYPHGMVGPAHRRVGGTVQGRLTTFSAVDPHISCQRP